MKFRHHHQKQTHTPVSPIVLIIFTGLTLMLAGCANPGRQQPSSVPTLPSTAASAEPTSTSERAPGLIVHGSVQNGSGAGVENVQIYRSYSAYPGEVIATTDANGNYSSAFYPIPGDEMVSVWAEKAGAAFSPANCSWRHYYGYEEKECNFELVVE